MLIGACGTLCDVYLINNEWNKYKLSVLIITILPLPAHLIVSSLAASVEVSQLQVTANNTGQQTAQLSNQEGPARRT